MCEYSVIRCLKMVISWFVPLLSEVLKQVWDLSDQDNDSMLSTREFCIALYLMERYREGLPLPPALPSSILSDETLMAVSGQSPASFGTPNWGQPPGTLLNISTDYNVAYYYHCFFPAIFC